MATPKTASKTANEMTDACSKFLESLGADQFTKATYPYEELERIYWYYPPGNRHGLSLRDMDGQQRELAFGVLAGGLAETAYHQARQIIDLETVLDLLDKEEGKKTFVRDPELYYFTVFGEPGGEAPWGWRVEGHHISVHFSVWGNKVISTTPFFFGSNPAEVRKGPQAGLRILGAREDLAFELMKSLDAGQRSRAVIYDEAPLDILTYNSSKVMLPREEGLPTSRMTAGQKDTLMALVSEYVSQVRTDLARHKLADLKGDDLDSLYLAWGGPVRAGKAHYYRIHGGDFVVEFDNRQDDANHVHSVWRDVENDFAQDVLRQHLLAYHVL